MPVQLFSENNEGYLIRKFSAEKHKLYYKPRRWLVSNDAIILNLYGEPGEPVSGSDGVTSIPATRQLTSVGSDFVTEGVLPSDVLEIQTPACNDGDNGKYQVNTVIDATHLTITEDWPLGSLTDIEFRVHFLKERYTEHPQLIPFNVKLNPTEQDLDKWGIKDKRDAMVVMSIQLVQDELGLTPKIGDRFVFPYGDADIHYELKELFEDGSLNDSGIPIWFVGAARRTTNRLPS